MPSIVELVSPNAALRDSYRTLITEFEAASEQLVPFVLGFEHRDFDALLARLDQCSRGIGLPPGFVPHSTYWLIRDQLDVVGVANIRHALTPALRREGGNIGYGIRPSARGRGLGTQILSSALDRARDLGLHEVLITCGKTNVASASVIGRNGGVLQSEEFLPQRGETVQRYVIQTMRRPADSLPG